MKIFKWRNYYKYLDNTKSYEIDGSLYSMAITFVFEELFTETKDSILDRKLKELYMEYENISNVFRPGQIWLNADEHGVHYNKEFVIDNSGKTYTYLDSGETYSVCGNLFEHDNNGKIYKLEPIGTQCILIRGADDYLLDKKLKEL